MTAGIVGAWRTTVTIERVESGSVAGTVYASRIAL